MGYFKVSVLNRGFGKSVVKLFINVVYKAFISIELNVFEVDSIDSFHYLAVLWRYCLSAVFPIYFIAVVFWWVVRSSKYYTRLAT